MSKVFLFGIDGGEPSLVFDKWRHELPNLNKLMSEGCYGRMNSSVPPLTILAWNSMISGKDPSEIGIFSYTYKDAEGKSRIVSSANQECDLIWDILGRHEKKSVSLYVPLSYPVKKFPGCMVSGFLTPSLESSCTYPETLKEKIKLLGDPEIFFDIAVGLAGHKGLEIPVLIENAYKMTDMQISLLKDMLQNEEWDFFMSVMLGSDRLQHMLWRHFDKTHRRFIEGSEFANVIKDYYIYLDKKLGEIINLLPPDVTIIVCSDHGMIKQEGKININNWLIQEGYLVVKKNVDLSQKVRFKLEFVDLEKSVAWGSGAYNGRIFINKEKLGIKWEQLRDEIAQKITRIPDDKGNPLDTKAFKAEEIYNDLSRPQCPDLTIYFDNLRWASNPDLGQQGLYSWHTAVGADNAGHSTQGLCIIHAPDVAKKGEMPDIDIRQIAPTILQRMQVPIPKDIQIPALEVFN